MLTDTHAHLYWDSFRDDLDEVVSRAREAGVDQIINVGVDLEKSQQALDQLEHLERQGLKAYSTVGIHPHEAIKYHSSPDVSIQTDCDKLEQIYLSNPRKVVGVGECGLDFFFREEESSIPISDQKDLQRKLLLAQKNLAKKLGLPLIVHVRDDRTQNPQNSICWNEALELVKDHYGIFHCYSGFPPTTQKILETKFLISFAGTITYPKNDYLREAAKSLPLEKIILETDCPFLPSQQNRGKRNEPSTVLEIATLISNLKGISLEELSIKTTENVKALFKIN